MGEQSRRKPSSLAGSLVRLGALEIVAAAPFED
jgi:hypothetical protein